MDEATEEMIREIRQRFNANVSGIDSLQYTDYLLSQQAAEGHTARLHDAAQELASRSAPIESLSLGEYARIAYAASVITQATQTALLQENMALVDERLFKDALMAHMPVVAHALRRADPSHHTSPRR